MMPLPPNATTVLLELFADTDAQRDIAMAMRWADEDPEPGMVRNRARIAETLGHHGDRRAASVLVAWLSELDRGTKGIHHTAAQRVLTSLGRLGGPEAVVPLLARSEAGDNAMVPLLGECGDSSAVPALCAKLRKPDLNGDYHLQQNLAEALAQIGDPSALPALKAIDPGPVTESSRRSTRDDDTRGMYLEACEGIHKAIATLKR